MSLTHISPTIIALGRGKSRDAAPSKWFPGGQILLHQKLQIPTIGHSDMVGQLVCMWTNGIGLLAIFRMDLGSGKNLLQTMREC
jgi:hypothetical protein